MRRFTMRRPMALGGLLTVLLAPSCCWAATVPSGVIVPWPSTNASIPAGWSRVTAWDTLYIAGAATSGDAGGTGGAATHTHASPSHTPIQNAHTHTVSAGASSGTVGTLLGLVAVASHGHTHASSTSASTTATNNGIAITVNANTSNDLPYVTVIWIQSDGTPTGLPSTAYAFFDSDTLPTNWTRVQGNTYLKGAAAGADGGGTGGSLTHGHTSPAHTHTQNAHTHAATNSSGSTQTTLIDDAFPNFASAKDGHVHSVTLTTTTPTNQSVTTAITDANHEPQYAKLNIISNGTGGADLPASIIALWGSTNASIPSGWSRVTALDGLFVKGANANGEVLTTGGAQTHTHPAADCQPTQNSHTHGTSVAALSLGNKYLVDDDIGTTVTAATHTHTWTVSTTTATNQAVTVTVSANTAKSAYPPYVEAIFIKLTPATRRRVSIVSHH